MVEDAGRRGYGRVALARNSRSTANWGLSRRLGRNSEAYCGVITRTAIALFKRMKELWRATVTKAYRHALPQSRYHSKQRHC